MLWQYARASYLFRVSVWVGFWALLPAIYAITEGALVHRRLLGFYPAKARVIEKIRGASRSGPRIRIEYRDIERHLHQARIGVSRAGYASLAPRVEVAVFISEVKPSDAWLMSSGKPGYRGVRIAAVVAALMLLPAVFALWRAARRVAVLRAGQPAAGQVVKVVRENPNHLRTPYDYYVLYRYDAPNGASHERRSPRIRRQLADRWRKRRHITVYFDPAYPERAEADVYEFRKAG